LFINSSIGNVDKSEDLAWVVTEGFNLAARLVVEPRAMVDLSMRSRTKPRVLMPRYLFVPILKQ
jgi:hypothetical protein